MSYEATELLACPWCGADMKLHAINYPWADGEPGWNIWHEDMGEAGKRKCPMEMGCYDTREEAIDAWNTRAAHGTLTAEQVRKAIFSGSVYASYDGSQYYANGIDMQAIADELNAEFGSGTCEPTEDGCCQYCGEDLIRCDMTIGDGGGAVELDPPIYHNYCPNCGRRVKR